MLLGLRRASLLALIALACAACLTSCQDRSNSPVVTINILGSRGGHSYNPGNIVVNLGTLVTWVNQDSQPHSATSPGAFDSGMIAPNGGKWTWTAAMQGTFTYSSLTDPSMSGTITVVAQPPTQ
jgi:plastocyanin